MKVIEQLLHGLRSVFILYYSVKTGEEQRFSAESRASIVTVPGHHLQEALKYKVWVEAVNALGNATSKDLAFELNDIGTAL